MKIKPEHYQHMLEAIRSDIDFIAPYRKFIIAEGKAKDVEKRLHWDIFLFSVRPKWVCDNLYPYANDDHIDTALKRIFSELTA